ncbi:hybrid sensor histidine kinase/response regulator transcription factor [Arenibacter nanhaiticus]|nr:two-component regulator propeller domain-containing protein [Arenibacter nanhaiticus]
MFTKRKLIREPMLGVMLWLWFLGSTAVYCQKSSNFIKLPFTLDNQKIRVYQTVQDSLGFVWLAHGNGLSKYDGHRFTFISSDKIFKEDLNQNEVKKILKDSYSRIWVLSTSGELRYLAANDTFLPIGEEANSILKNHKLTMFMEEKGILWLGTSNGGIFTYDVLTGKLNGITTIPNVTEGSTELTSMVVRNSEQLIVSTYMGPVYIYSLVTGELKEFNVPYETRIPDNVFLLLDNKDRLWLGSSYVNHGLLIYDFDTKNFVQDAIFDKERKNLLKDPFTFMYKDSKGIFWIGTDGNGLFKINLDTDEFQNYKHNDLNEFSLSSNTILDIYEDMNHNLWVISNYGDIKILPNPDGQFKYHSGSLNNKTARVLSTYRAQNNALWIGTDGQGLMKFSEESKLEKQFFASSKKQKAFYIHTINEDRNNDIWVGTYKNGLWVYDKEIKEFSKIPLVGGKGLEASDVRTSFRDAKDRIWVATDIGVYVFADKNRLLASFPNNSAGLSGIITQSIVQDHKGGLWLGSDGGGLFEFKEDFSDFSKSTFKQYPYVDEKGQTKKSFRIQSMAAVSNGDIWVVTTLGSLLKFDPKTGEFKSMEINDPSKKVVFRSVVSDSQEKLWLGSSHGLWNYNPKDSLLKIFYDKDGLQDNYFMPRSAHRGADGYLYFGSLNGVNYFKPNNLKKKEYVPNLLLEEIKILNQPAISVIPEQLKNGVEKITHLSLEHDQSSFSFRFLALDNVLFPHYSYAYRLKGFNEDWVISENERLASYTNIPPGNYVFEVKAGTDKDLWNIAPIAINIHIAQPFWNTPWAHIIYVLLALALIYSIFVWLQLRNKLASEELQNRHERELYALKMNFFAKMSHEIQTPLTLILIPLENMIDRAVKSGNVVLEKRLRLIENNARRLSRIVFELTSLRDKELEKLVLRASPGDIIEDLKLIVASFEEQADFKGIRFRFNYPSNGLTISYDKEKIEHVFYNLLSNAFKFTPKGGTICLDILVEEWDKKVKISITDSGPGIPKEELDSIFKLFYQTGAGKEKIGTGIGLALTKELVDLHNGSIDVKSDPEKGSCFIVTLPIIRDLDTVSEENKSANSLDEGLKENTLEVLPSKDLSTKEQSKTILIVEDNYELQISLKDIFRDSYQIILADDGKEGYDLALQHLPDLIISDVMMPKIDGIQMSEMLLKNTNTAHIPIILLTAKKESQSKILGLRAGAVEYINKPFNINELILKVNNILTRRDRLLFKFKNDLISTPTKGNLKSQDEIFLDKIVALIENNMGNPDFKLEDLAVEFNMSYSAIYRKFQALTGKKIVDFVRTMRLKKAAVLIGECNYSISEAAFMVGFNDPKYFSKCFKKEFGKSPGKLKGKNRTNSSPEA